MSVAVAVGVEVKVAVGVGVAVEVGVGDVVGVAEGGGRRGVVLAALFRFCGAGNALAAGELFRDPFNNDGSRNIKYTAYPPEEIAPARTIRMRAHCQTGVDGRFTSGLRHDNVDKELIPEGLPGRIESLPGTGVGTRIRRSSELDADDRIRTAASRHQGLLGGGPHFQTGDQAHSISLTPIAGAVVPHRPALVQGGIGRHLAAIRD